VAKKFTKLTRPQMRKLPSGGKITESGILFSRLKDGDGRFAINVMVDGERIHRVVGKESEGVTRDQVENIIAGLKTKAREDRLNLPKGRKVAIGFKEAAIKYIEELEDSGGKDIKNKKRRLAQHLIPFFKNMPLSKVTTSDIDRYKDTRSKEKAISGGEKNKALDITKIKNTSNGTINRELAVISHLLNKAIEWNWISSKTVKIVLLPENYQEKRYLTPEEIVEVRKQASGDMNSHISLFVDIGFDTGMRKSEILAIRIDDINVNSRCIYIPQAKAGAREQPITQRLALILDERIKQKAEDQEWLFPSLKSRTGHVANIDKAFRRVIAVAGLDNEGIVRHTMRHTAVTHLVQAGVDIPTVMRISGHKTISMVLRYAHQNSGHVEDAMDKLEKRIDPAA